MPHFNIGHRKAASLLFGHRQPVGRFSHRHGSQSPIKMGVEFLFASGLAVLMARALLRIPDQKLHQEAQSIIAAQDRGIHFGIG